MYIPFEENLVVFGLVGVFFVLLYLLLFRKVWMGAYDPFFLGLVFLGFNSCFIASVFYVPVFRPIIILVGVFSFLGAFRLGVGNLCLVLKSSPKYVPRASYELVIGVILAVATILVFLDFLINVLPTIGMVDDVGSSRYLLGANNRFLSLVGYPSRSLPLVFLWLTRNSWLRLLCVLLLVYEPIYSVINGSKGALFGLSLKFGILLFLYQVLFDDVVPFGGVARFRVNWRRFFNYFIVIVAVFSTVATPLYLSREFSLTGYMDGLTVIGQRLLLGFDSAFMAIQINMDFPSDGLNLFQLWFASPLKVLGLFSSDWNGINEYVAMNFMSLNAGQRMQFPNNFMILEVFGSVGWIIGVPFVAILGYATGFFIKLAASRRCKLIWAFWFSVMATNPYQFLIDGQSFINTMIVTAVFSIPLYFVDSSASRASNQGIGTANHSNQRRKLVGI